jgi:WD40 repeat protein
MFKRSLVDNIYLKCLNKYLIYDLSKIIITYLSFTSSIKQELKDHSRTVNCLAVINTKFIISGSVDKDLKIYELTDDKYVHKKTLYGHNNEIDNILVMNENTIISSSRNIIIVWTLLNNFTKYTYHVLKNYCNSLEASLYKVTCLAKLENDIIISNTYDDLIQFDLQKNKVRYIFQENTDYCTSIASNLNNLNIIISGHNNGSLQLWKLENNAYFCKQIIKYNFYFNFEITVNMKVFIVNNKIISTYGDTYIRIYNFSNNMMIDTDKKNIIQLDNIDSAIACIDINTEHNLMIYSCMNGKTYICDLFSYKLLYIFKDFQNYIKSIVMHDANIISGTHDLIQVWR